MGRKQESEGRDKATKQEQMTVADIIDSVLADMATWGLCIGWR